MPPGFRNPSTEWARVAPRGGGRPTPGVWLNADYDPPAIGTRLSRDFCSGTGCHLPEGCYLPEGMTVVGDALYYGRDGRYYFPGD